MTSMTSPSDTIRLRSRLSAADFGYSGNTGPTRPTAPGVDPDHTDQPVIFDDIEVIEVIEPPDSEAALDLGQLNELLDGATITRPSMTTRFLVRTFDLVVAIVGLVVLAPLMVLVAIAVMVDSSGPIVYGSPRLGHKRPTFRAWKFRSMYLDAEADLDRILAIDDEARQEYETYHKLHNDPRLTRVGAVIRQTSLDELPQLINILLGQMSVVGPRPKLAKDAEAYGPLLGTVLLVKPGLTGLWQVSGRNLLPMSERVVLDLDYVQNRTLIGDVTICARTFVQLWQPGKHGAY